MPLFPQSEIVFPEINNVESSENNAAFAIFEIPHPVTRPVDPAIAMPFPELPATLNEANSSSAHPSNASNAPPIPTMRNPPSNESRDSETPPAPLADTTAPVPTNRKTVSRPAPDTTDPGRNTSDLVLNTPAGNTTGTRRAAASSIVACNAAV